MEMKIKTTLKQLYDRFVEYVGEDVPAPIKRFAAQLAVLTTHVRQLQISIGVLDAQLAELVTHVHELRGQGGAPAGQQGVAPPDAPPRDAQPQQPQQQSGGPDLGDEAEAMAEAVRAETQAELDALSAPPSQAPPAPAQTQEGSVTPLRKASNNNKAPSAGGAA